MGRISRPFARPFSRLFTWRWWPRGKNKSADDAELASEKLEGGDRRQLLQALTAVVGGGPDYETAMVSWAAFDHQVTRLAETASELRYRRERNQSTRVSDLQRRIDRRVS